MNCWLQSKIAVAKAAKNQCVHNLAHPHDDASLSFLGLHVISLTIASMSARRRPLRQRPLDALYLVYFVFHIATFLCIDGQNFVPSHVVPAALRRVMDDYLRDSGDPFVHGLRAGDGRYTWFATSMYSSLVFQNPVFVAGAWCLWKDDRRIYPVMAAYALLAGVTTMQCVAHVLYGNERQHLTPDNVSFLLKSYTPFVLIPCVMLVDTLRRSIKLISSAGERGVRRVDKRRD